MENSIEELREKAAALNIDVDRRWSPGTLQEKIDEATHAAEMEQAKADSARAAAEQPTDLVEVKLLRNYRPAAHTDPEGGLWDKYPKGEIVKLPADEASVCVRKRIATRDLEAEDQIIASWAEHEGA